MASHVELMKLLLYWPIWPKCSVDVTQYGDDQSLV